MTFCTQTWLRIYSTLLCCTAVGRSRTSAPLGAFQTIRTTFLLCWVSWAWADGVSLRALLFLLLLIFALNWKMMSRLKGTCLLLYATCQMFQHVLYIGHFMVIEALGELVPMRFLLQKCCLGLFIYKKVPSELWVCIASFQLTQSGYIWWQRGFFG